MQDNDFKSVQIQFLLAVIYFFSLVNQCYSQKLVVGLGAPILAPIGQLKNHCPVSTGINAFFALQPEEDARFMIGFDYSTNTYATFTERVPFTKTGYNGTEADKTTNNKINQYQLFSKIFPYPDIAVQPYIDVRLGITQMRTQQYYAVPYQTTRLKTVSLNNSKVFNYGGGLGVQANLSKIIFDVDDPWIAVMVDFRIGYTQGAKATYQNIKENSNPYVNSAKYNSRSSFMNYCFSLYFEF